MKTIKKISGQSLVEFAIVLPLILFLVIVLFDVGRAIFYYATLNTAVREGTRFAVVQSLCDYKSDPGACDGAFLDSYPLNCTSAQSTANINICNKVTEKFYNLGELSSSIIMIDHPVSSTGDPSISIDITFLFEPVMPGLSLIGNLPMNVNSQMIMTPMALSD